MRIVFLVTNASYTLMQQRVAGLQQVGIEARVMAFERNSYSGRPWPNGYHSLGKLQDGRYFNNLPTMVKAIAPVRLAVRECDVLYAFGFGNLLLGWLASRFLGKPVKLVYDVFDIREILIRRGLISGLLRGLERFILQYLTLLIVTSEAYISGYYHGMLNLANIRYIVIENKLDTELLQMTPEPKRRDRNGVIRIGFFGTLRCPRSWEILKRVVAEGKGKIEVYVRGFPSIRLPYVEAEARAINGIHYAGTYVSPHDLPEMYGRVDIVWAGYPYGGNKVGNWQWARTRRFYETCFFKKPMIVQARSEDGKVVQSRELGLYLDLSDLDAAVKQILSITEEDLTHWQQNVADLPKEIYVHSNEYRK